jgi:hypothetical protein
MHMHSIWQRERDTPGRSSPRFATGETEQRRRVAGESAQFEETAEKGRYCCFRG